MKHKSYFAFILIALMLITALPFQVNMKVEASSVLFGEGSSENPYILSNAEQLLYMAERVNSKETKYLNAHYVMTEDIDLSGYLGWDPIARSDDYPFSGVFDGQGHRITGLLVNANNGDNYHGLFGVNQGIIKNLDLEIEISIDKVENTFVGGLAGMNLATIDTCTITNSAISGGNHTGGIVGENNGLITECINSATVISEGDFVGGITGANYDQVKNSLNTDAVTGTGYYTGGVAGYNAKTIENCINSGLVTGGHSYVGGITAFNDITVANCRNEGEITGDQVGGIVGLNYRNVDNCDNAGNVYSDSGDSGGIAARNKGTISNCHNKANVSSFARSGGIAGTNEGLVTKSFNIANLESQTYTLGGIAGENSNSITDCFNAGGLSGKNDVGGIAGINNGTISSCYNTKSVQANHNAAGIAVMNESTIINCYNTGSVACGEGQSGGIASLNRGSIDCSYNVGNITGASAVIGGIVGLNAASSVIKNSYYFDNVARGSGTGPDTSLKLTLAQMLDEDFYEGFDFVNVWIMRENHSYRFPQLNSLEAPLLEENIHDYDGGYGTQYAPYLISTKQHLNNVRLNLNASYRLTEDLVFDQTDFAQGGEFCNNNAGWLPIGSGPGTEAFGGIFDGQGKRIAGLQMNPDEGDGYYGLFGYNQGKISQLDLEIEITSQDEEAYIGGIAGYNHFGMLEDCITDFTINGNGEYCGGIAGYNSGTISNCDSICTASVDMEYLGGITGYNLSNITSCTASGTMENSGVYIGGISGFNFDFSASHNGEPECIVQDCQNQAALSGSVVGGIVANNLHGNIINCNNLVDLFSLSICGGIAAEQGSGNILSCSNSGEITAVSGQAGGITAANISGLIRDCYNEAGVAGKSEAGGIAGVNYGILNKSYNTAPVQADTYAGGIVGVNESLLSDCYNAGSVVCGEGASGGIAGANKGSIDCSYNVGNVAGASVDVGGIAGLNSFPTSIVNNSYYLDQISKGIGRGEDTSIRSTFSEMRDKNFYEEFDFENIWIFRPDASYKFPQLISLEMTDIQENTSDYAGGTGTLYDPYLISTKQHLDNVRLNLNASYQLTNDLIFDSSDFAIDGNYYNDKKAWQPIGSKPGVEAFGGIFDGQGFKITGLTLKIDGGDGFYGLFGCNQGSIRQLELEIEITGDDEQAYIGGISGNNVYGTIENCGSVCTITGDGRYSGGISGQNNGNIINCNVDYTADVSAVFTGGIAGYNSSIIHGCMVSGTIKNDGYYTGGVTGYNDETIRASSNEATITNTTDPYEMDVYQEGGPSIGGIAGDNWGIIADCTNSGDVSSNIILENADPVNDKDKIHNLSENCRVGGIAAINYRTIENCHNSGHVIGNAFTGGITTSNGDLIDSCTNSGSITGYGKYTSGISCLNSGSITSSDNKGDIKSIILENEHNDAGTIDPYTAGIVSYNGGLINECYNIGNIFGGYNTGGIAGSNSNDSKIENCYNTGALMKGTMDAGGIVGTNFGQIKGCYNTGGILDGVYVGGIAGRSFANISNSYYLDTLKDGVGYGSVITQASSWQEMVSKTLYEDFDFDNTWMMLTHVDNPPVLQRSNKSDTVYNVDFVTYGGGIMDSIRAIYGARVQIPKDPVKAGYSLAGWYTEEELLREWDFDTDYVKEDLVLHAKWQLNLYTVTFTDWDGTVLKTDQVYEGGAAIAPTIPSRAGHTFTGWDVDFSKITRNITVTAQYKINRYSVTYESLGGTQIVATEADYATTIKKPADPEKEGYIFSGWYIDKAYSYVWNFSKDIVEEDLILYAKWQIRQYTVTFEDWDGKELKKEIVDYAGSATAPADPERTGHSFAGWDKGYTDIKKALRVTAQYTINNYRITFNSNGGSAVSSIRTNYDTLISKPADPKKEGSTFAGWFSDQAFTKPWDFKKNRVREDTALFAKWAINSYEVSFVDWDKTLLARDMVAHGKSAKPPLDPERNGYEFVGWDRPYDNVRDKLIVTAQYSKLEEMIKSQKIEIDRKEQLLGPLPENTTVDTLIHALSVSPEKLIVKKKDGQAISNMSQPLTTGMTVMIVNQPASLLTVVIKGDINGDGTISALDLLQARQYLLGRLDLHGAYRAAASVTGSSNPSALDLLQIKRHLLGQVIIK